MCATQPVLPLLEQDTRLALSLATLQGSGDALQRR